MKKIDPIMAGIIILIIMVMGGVLAAALSQRGAPIPQYTTQESPAPRLLIDETVFDFGTMKLEETKVKEIRLTNRGEKPLVINDVITSCDCTFAQFIIGGRESPRFSMHRNPQWRGEISPRGEAVVRVTYQPSIMPVKGRVTREVVFRTNDPLRPLVNLKFTADVE
ncbi:MAG: DUF1573 domain-containing protein [Patescibacteria group bacterium]